MVVEGDSMGLIGLNLSIFNFPWRSGTELKKFKVLQLIKVSNFFFSHQIPCKGNTKANRLDIEGVSWDFTICYLKILLCFRRNMHINYSFRISAEIKCNDRDRQKQAKTDRNRRHSCLLAFMGNEQVSIFAPFL